MVNGLGQRSMFDLARTGPYELDIGPGWADLGRASPDMCPS